jgi:hypothetical protein
MNVFMRVSLCAGDRPGPRICGQGPPQADRIESKFAAKVIRFDDFLAGAAL